MIGACLKPWTDPNSVIHQEMNQEPSLCCGKTMQRTASTSSQLQMLQLMLHVAHPSSTLFCLCETMHKQGKGFECEFLPLPVNSVPVRSLQVKPQVKGFHIELDSTIGLLLVAMKTGSNCCTRPLKPHKKQESGV